MSAPTNTILAMLLAASFSGLVGCASQAPSIAHVHVGHAITGAHDTPSKQGYFVLAEERAAAAMTLATKALEPNLALEQIQASLMEVNNLVNARADYPLNAALKEAAGHITYAAESDDASENVKKGAATFAISIDDVLYRNSLIKLYSTDAGRARSLTDAVELAKEIAKLARSNIQGQDLDRSGIIGDAPREQGLAQMRLALDKMVASENPPYRTVDRWYLFNLIRLPSGDWIFRRSNSGGSRGY